MDKIFKVTSSSQAGIQSAWSGHAEDKNFSKIELCIPPEFEGPGLGYSPEDLYALALLNCFIATFKFVAEKSRLEYREVSGFGNLVVDKGDRNTLWMNQFKIFVELNGVKQPERALALLEKTSKNCMIINSVQTEVTFSFQVKE